MGEEDEFIKVDNYQIIIVSKLWRTTKLSILTDHILLRANKIAFKITSLISTNAKVRCVNIKY